MTEFEYLWEKLKHEDTLFSNRANFFLVAQSLLFASIVVFHTDSKFKIIDTSLGIIIAMIWFYCSFRNIAVQENIKDEMNTHKPPVEIKEITPSWLSTHILMGMVMPIIFLISWLFILYFRFTK